MQPASGAAPHELYPCCYSTHAAVQGALELVRSHRVFTPGTIARVDCAAQVVGKDAAAAAARAIEALESLDSLLELTALLEPAASSAPPVRLVERIT